MSITPPTEGGRLGTWLGRLALTAYVHPWRVLLTCLVATLLSLVGARSLSLNADLTALLPARFASVQALTMLEQRSGATGYIVVVAEGAPLKAARRYAEALAPRLEALKGILYVDLKRASKWTADHALHFAAQTDLNRWAEQLEERVDREIQAHSPLGMDLEEDDEPPPPLDFAALKKQGQLDWIKRQSAGDYYEDNESRTLAVFARPSADIADLNVGTRTLAEVRSVLANLDPTSFHPTLSVSLTGRYQKQLDHKEQLKRDLGLSSSLALGLVLLYLAFYFRRLDALLHLGLPLVLGLVTTFGIVGVTFGQLNILTAFIGAILLGLGIDHGIHLLSSYYRLLATGSDPRLALVQSFSHTGRAVTIAAVTTLSGFLGLSVSEFRTFREFGIVAALGLFLVLVAYTVCLPALLRLSTTRLASSHATARGFTGIWRRPRTSLVVGAMTLAACIAPVLSLSFDYDFAALQDTDLPSYRLDRRVNQLLGYSQTPTLILTEGVAQEERISTRLRAASDERGDNSTVDMVISLSDFVPADPRDKLAAIDKMAQAAHRIRPTWLDNDRDRDSHQRLLTLTSQQPVSLSTLPKSLKQQLGVKPGRTPAERKGVVMVFPAISLAQGNRVVDFSSEVQSAAEGAPVAGESMVLADILTTVRSESRWVLALTALGVFLALWLLQQHLRHATIAMASAALSLAAALGLSAACGIPLNYLNIVAIPVLFGVAVDGAVHLLSQKGGGVELVPALRAIAASLVTTALGFGTLLLADHPGLRSMGALALLGLGSNALVSLVVLPTWLSRSTGSHRVETKSTGSASST